MTSLNVVDAKKQFSELLGRVAFRGESILITRRGKPMAKLVPLDTADKPRHLASVEGWLENDDPFFATVDDIVEGRSQRLPRAFGQIAEETSGE